jgi:hypothetical protein
LVSASTPNWLSPSGRSNQDRFPRR